MENDANSFCALWDAGNCLLHSKHNYMDNALVNCFKDLLATAAIVFAIMNLMCMIAMWIKGYAMDIYGRRTFIRWGYSFFAIRNNTFLFIILENKRCICFNNYYRYITGNFINYLQSHWYKLSRMDIF